MRRRHITPHDQVCYLRDPKLGVPTQSKRTGCFYIWIPARQGIGRVRATHFGQPLPGGKSARGDNAGPVNGRAPADTEPQKNTATQTTNVIADRMFARRRDQFVRYEGHVRAWHGPDVVESSSLDYYGNGAG